MALQDDDRPMADRRDLKVSKRQKLLRKRNGTITPTKQMAVPPTAREGLVVLVAQGGVNPRSKKPAVAVSTLEDLAEEGLAHLTMGQKGMVWRATDAGRGWVAASGLLPVFLHRRSELGTTHSAAMGLVSAGEDMRPMSERPRVPKKKKRDREEREETLAESIKAMKARQAAAENGEQTAA